MESPQQNLTDIFYFVQVVRHGSLTRAAQELGVAKSRLSTRLARLERQLGVRLIQRTTRRLHVTDVGHSYFDHCRGVLEAAERAQDVIDDAKAAPRGRIRVAAPSSFVQMLLEPILLDFMERNPEVQIDLDPARQEAGVVADGHDVVFRVRTSLEDSSMVARSFGLDPQVLVGAPALLKRVDGLRRPSDLKNLSSVATPPPPAGRHFWLLRHAEGGTETQVEHHPRLVSDDLLLLRRAAIGGVGIVQLPEFICRAGLQSGSLKRVLPKWELPPGNVHALYPTRRGHTPALRSFIEYVALRVPQALEDLQRRAPHAV